MDDRRLALLVPRSLVKQVKTALEEQNVLNRSRKITTAVRKDECTETCMTLYTTLPYESDNESSKTTILEKLGLKADTNSHVSLTTYSSQTEPVESASNNPLLKGLKNGLNSLPRDLLESLQLTVEALLTSFPEAYSIYKPLLLLPPNAFTSAPWTTLLYSHPVTSPALQPLWTTLVTSTGTTHLALNAGIPLQKEQASQTPDLNSENTFRSPLNLTPLYPPSFVSSRTDCKDFSSALWVSHTQNHIHQVWAPLYTMFSRGNIKEKARLLSLPSVVSSVANAKNTGGCTAVDLYAGIGYFAFSYRKAGVKRVLCWEVNEWSVEGLRRGAKANGWSVKTVAGNEIPETKEKWGEWAKGFEKEQGGKDESEGVDFVVFQQSNEYALDAVAALQPSKFEQSTSIPRHGKLGGKELLPIRHVNCGFLPSSKLSWETAVKVLDRELGGWIHAHENVAVKDIEKRAGEVVIEIQRIVDGWEKERGGSKRRVDCEHVEKVKTYAPGVMHVVFDVWVSGIATEGL